MRALPRFHTCLVAIAGALVGIASTGCAGTGGGGLRGGGNLAADTSRAFTRTALNAPPIAVMADSSDQPLYPDALRLAQLEGDVTAEFVVDSAGRIDNKSIRIVQSSDARLSASVTTWLVDRHFTPARKDGRAMAARTSQEFHFGLYRLKGNPGDSGAGGNPRPRCCE